MTDKIIISRKEIEDAIDTLYIETFSGEPYIAGTRKILALLDKAEVVRGEAVGEIKIYWGSDTGYEYGLTLIGGALGSQKEYNEWIVKNFNGEGVFKLYTSPRDQSAKIAELEAEIARLKAIIEDMKVVDNVFSK